MNEEKKGYIIIFVTASSVEEGQKIGRTLVEERLVACINIVSPIQSIFQWQGRVSDEREALLIAKTKSALFNDIVVRVKKLHSYKVPEIIAVPIVDGSQDYLNWISAETLK
ncbi:MAG: divalent-cation tolerance protein CutA [Planctomycetes bacterium]|nr:divalent-cation tolerance protein CutA [Planctomycetota bacterium]